MEQTHPGNARATPDEETTRRFVEHWGLMARAWGINPSMGELFALLFITGKDLSAEDLKEKLGVSRGNISMNLRELIAWGVVHKVHRPGERKEFYRAETDVWILFRRILGERRRRELDPTLEMLDETKARIPDNPEFLDQKRRVEELSRFFSLVHDLSTLLLNVDRSALSDLASLLGIKSADASSPGPETH